MTPPPVDRSALLDTVDGDPEFLDTLVHTFLDDCPTYLESIRTAVREEDADELVQESHGLKGAVGLLHARPARRAAQQLEELGRKGNLEDAPEALDALTEEIDRLRPALREIVDDVQADG